MQIRVRGQQMHSLQVGQKRVCIVLYTITHRVFNAVVNTLSSHIEVLIQLNCFSITFSPELHSKC